eukprot:gene12549-16828_t
MELLKCINSSSVITNSLITNQFHKIYGPTLNIGIVTYATDDIWNYSAFSFAINHFYSSYHNYMFKILDNQNSNFERKDSRWNKVMILLAALDENGWGRNLDYIMWIDADLIFIDFNLKIEQYFSKYPNAHLFISAEHAGSTTLINSGSVIVRNTIFGKSFLQKWWEYNDRKLFSDQEQFDMLYNDMVNNGINMSEKIAILAPDAINSDPPAMTQQKPSNEVLHLMGEQERFRIRVFKSGLIQICDNILKNNDSNSSLLPLQLSLSRENLLYWTLEEYKIESELLLKSYELSAKHGKNGLTESRALSNSVHHYAHALENLFTINDAKKAEKLRRKLYFLLKLNLNSRRKFGINEHNWPELVKTVATAGQLLTNVGTVKERKQIVTEMMEYIDEMMRGSHEKQHHAIKHMTAHTLIQFGLIELEGGNQNIHQALHYFQKSLELSSELSTLSGEHILVNPLTLTANALSTIGQYDEAQNMYKKAIDLTDRHVGRGHHSIISLLVNYGISLVQSDDYDKAKQVLQESINLMTINNDS